MKKEKIYLSTIASDAVRVAKEYGVNIEIAEYCTAWNMDEKFTGVDSVVKNMLEGIPASALHAPYNELFPCAIDKKARALAADRYRQAIDLAKRYGSAKVIIHGGYNPWIYFPVWYVEQSILFWKEFLAEDPGVEIVLENVLETEPQWLLDIVKGVDDPRLRLCLDVGHVNAYSKIPVIDWLKEWAPYLSHFHIHNNDGTADQHKALMDGTIPVKELLRQIEQCCSHGTITLELMEAETSIRWLMEETIWNF
ncbi:MAG: sugar phosphate isomerase/epimerase [Oscillospiraceae bacterium]|nr:sugar phosphate isomerase/epimerase [Oscillospiraceae bacterium]